MAHNILTSEQMTVLSGSGHPVTQSAAGSNNPISFDQAEILRVANAPLTKKQEMDLAGPHPSWGFDDYLKAEPPMGFFTNPPQDTMSVISTENSTRPPRNVHHPVSTRTIYPWFPQQIETAATMIMEKHGFGVRKYWQTPHIYADLYQFFDGYDLWNLGVQNCWNVICHIIGETQKELPGRTRVIRGIIEDEMDKMMAMPGLRAKLFNWDHDNQDSPLQAFDTQDLAVMNVIDGCYYNGLVDEVLLDIHHRLRNGTYAAPEPDNDLPRDSSIQKHATEASEASDTTVKPAGVEKSSTIEEVQTCDEVINGIIIIDGTSLTAAKMLKAAATNELTNTSDTASTASTSSHSTETLVMTPTESPASTSKGLQTLITGAEAMKIRASSEKADNQQGASQDAIQAPEVLQTTSAPTSRCPTTTPSSNNPSGSLPPSMSRHALTQTSFRPHDPEPRVRVYEDVPPTPAYMRAPSYPHLNPHHNPDNFPRGIPTLPVDGPVYNAPGPAPIVSTKYVSPQQQRLVSNASSSQNTPKGRTHVPPHYEKQLHHNNMTVVQQNGYVDKGFHSVHPEAQLALDYNGRRPYGFGGPYHPPHFFRTPSGQYRGSCNSPTGNGIARSNAHGRLRGYSSVRENHRQQQRQALPSPAGALPNTPTTNRTPPHGDTNGNAFGRGQYSTPPSSQRGNDMPSASHYRGRGPSDASVRQPSDGTERSRRGSFLFNEKKYPDCKNWDKRWNSASPEKEIYVPCDCPPCIQKDHSIYVASFKHRELSDHRVMQSLHTEYSKYGLIKNMDKKGKDENALEIRFESKDSKYPAIAITNGRIDIVPSVRLRVTHPIGSPDFVPWNANDRRLSSASKRPGRMCMSSPSPTLAAMPGQPARVEDVLGESRPPVLYAISESSEQPAARNSHSTLLQSAMVTSNAPKDSASEQSKLRQPTPQPVTLEESSHVSGLAPRHDAEVAPVTPNTETVSDEGMSSEELKSKEPAPIDGNMQEHVAEEKEVPATPIKNEVDVADDDVIDNGNATIIRRRNKAPRIPLPSEFTELSSSNHSKTPSPSKKKGKYKKKSKNQNGSEHVQYAQSNDNQFLAFENYQLLRGEQHEMTYPAVSYYDGAQPQTSMYQPGPHQTPFAQPQVFYSRSCVQQQQASMMNSPPAYPAASRMQSGASRFNQPQFAGAEEERATAVTKKSLNPAGEDLHGPPAQHLGRGGRVRRSSFRVGRAGYRPETDPRLQFQQRQQHDNYSPAYGLANYTYLPRPVDVSPQTLHPRQPFDNQQVQIDSHRFELANSGPVVTQAANNMTGRDPSEPFPTYHDCNPQLDPSKSQQSAQPREALHKDIKDGKTTVRLNPEAPVFESPAQSNKSEPPNTNAPELDGGNKTPVEANVEWEQRIQTEETPVETIVYSAVNQVADLAVNATLQSAKTSVPDESDGTLRVKSKSPVRVAIPLQLLNRPAFTSTVEPSQTIDVGDASSQNTLGSEAESAAPGQKTRQDTKDKGVSREQTKHDVPKKPGHASKRLVATSEAGSTTSAKQSQMKAQKKQKGGKAAAVNTERHDPEIDPEKMEWRDPKTDSNKTQQWYPETDSEKPAGKKSRRNTNNSNAKDSINNKLSDDTTVDQPTSHDTHNTDTQGADAVNETKNKAHKGKRRNTMKNKEIAPLQGSISAASTASSKKTCMNPSHKSKAPSCGENNIKPATEAAQQESGIFFPSSVIQPEAPPAPRLSKSQKKRKSKDKGKMERQQQAAANGTSDARPGPNKNAQPQRRDTVSSLSQVEFPPLSQGLKEVTPPSTSAWSQGSPMTNKISGGGEPKPVLGEDRKDG